MIKDNATIGDKYHPAMKITTLEEANRYFEELVEHNMAHSAHSREDAERIEKINLGYFAGYYDDETRRRVERLFRCAHPIFGSIEENGSPTPEQAFQAGLDAAKKEG